MWSHALSPDLWPLAKSAEMSLFGPLSGKDIVRIAAVAAGLMECADLHMPSRMIDR